MAWRSSGEDNNEMASNLRRFGVISSEIVEEAFKKVDRKFFVPKDLLEMAYADRPLRNGNVHISAPHIYGSVCESLELPKDAPLSVLNVGSGTGYLTCIMASILGPRSCHYCVELFNDVVEHSKQSICTWQWACSGHDHVSNIHIVHGNALQIVCTRGEASFGFDRIYIGAAIRFSQLQRFVSLLKPGGILVGPVEDELIKITRSGTVQPEGLEFTKEILAEVNFAPLLCHPSKPTTLPSRVWEPSNHKLYPLSFRTCSKTLLLCCHARSESTDAGNNVNAASMLPQALWLEILSYVHRDWFRSSEFEFEYTFDSSMTENMSSDTSSEEDTDEETTTPELRKERRFFVFLVPRWERTSRQRQFIQNRQVAPFETP